MQNPPDLLHETFEACPWQLQHAGAYEAPRGKHFLPHQHPRHWEFVYYRRGAIRCTVGSDVYDVRPGTALLTPPGTVHAEYAHTAYANFYVLLDGPPVLDAPYPRICFDDAQQSLGTLCRSLVREWTGRETGRETLLNLLVAQWDILLRRKHEASRPAPPAEKTVAAAETLLRERSAFGVRIGDVAREVGVSPALLRAQFVRLRGETPVARLQAIRLEHALALLAADANLTLDAVADLCGYDSASHLSRHVKRATGRSPGACRNANQAQ